MADTRQATSACRCNKARQECRIARPKDGFRSQDDGGHLINQRAAAALLGLWTYRQQTCIMGNIEPSAAAFLLRICEPRKPVAINDDLSHHPSS